MWAQMWAQVTRFVTLVFRVLVSFQGSGPSTSTSSRELHTRLALTPCGAVRGEQISTIHGLQLKTKGQEALTVR